MKKGKSLIFLGLLLIVAALSLVVYNLYDERRAADAVDQAMQELPAKMQDIISGEDATEVPIIYSILTWICR